MSIYLHFRIHYSTFIVASALPLCATVTECVSSSLARPPLSLPRCVRLHHSVCVIWSSDHGRRAPNHHRHHLCRLQLLHGRTCRQLTSLDLLVLSPFTYACQTSDSLFRSAMLMQIVMEILTAVATSLCGLCVEATKLVKQAGIVA